jgi:hypothetical protein
MVHATGAPRIGIALDQGSKLGFSIESLSKRFFERMGYWPNIQEPRTLQEKILWRKLYEDMSEAVILADKVAVRAYVRDVIGEQYLIPALAIVDRAEDLDFDAFPDQFVAKVNHASAANVIVKDRSDINVDSVRRLLNSLLKLEYGRRLGEHWYWAMKPRIIVEQLLVDGEREAPIDYRFHVFHGKAEFIQVVTARSFSSDVAPGLKPTEGYAHVGHEAQHSTYGLDWRPAPFHFRTAVQPTPELEHIPAAAAEMVAIAEKLAGDWGYARVDLYCINDTQIYFGEITFAHNSGIFGFSPESYNEYFGSLWDIHRRYVRQR